MSWWADSWRSSFEGDVFNDITRQRPGRNLLRRIEVSFELEPGAANARFIKGAEVVATTMSFGFVDDVGWKEFCRRIAEQPPLSAAVLTGQLPAEIETLAAGAGIALNPTRKSVSSVCSCDEWDEPCTHVWALVEHLLKTIAVDPFAVLVLVGRSREQLVDQVRMARSGGAEPQAVAAGPRGPDTGVAASDAFDRRPGPIPVARPLPRAAGRPVRLPAPPPSDSGIDHDDLVDLVADVARRAAAVLQGIDTAGLHRDVDADLIRRAARFAEPGSPVGGSELEQLAVAAAVSVDQLRASAVAWRLAGEAGLTAHEHRWEPDAHLLEPAIDLVGPRPRVNGNVIAGSGMQLRLTPDYRWWRFEANDELGWILASDGFLDPADALPDA